MSTRGIVAVGTLARWQGIYNHYDSYPTGLGKDLYEHLAEQMTRGQKTLTEIGAAILAFDDWRNYLAGGVCPYCGQIASQAHDISISLDLRPKPGEYPDPDCQQHHHEPLSETYIYTRRDMKDSGLEWAYILDPKENCVHVLDLHRGPEPERHVGNMTFHAVPDFPVLECGAHFERCCHYAWAHFPAIERDGPQSRLNTKQYLGLEPLTELDSVCAFLIGGKRYARAGGGVNGRYVRTMPSLAREIPHPDPNAWYESVKLGNGKTKYLPAALFAAEGRIPYPGVTWVFPPTQVNPQETVRSSQVAVHTIPSL